MRQIFTICLLLLATQWSWAQLNTGSKPFSYENSLDSKIPTYTTPTIDVAALLAEDEIDLRANNPLRFAFGHDVRLNLYNSGQWTDLKNGDRVWQLKIHCPDAININLLYDKFYMPAGATFHLFDSKYSQILGAFTAQNNKDNQRFATALVHDEYVTLEYYEPAAVKGQGRLQIAQIGHGYRDMDGRSGEEKASGACQVDVNCEEGNAWQDHKKGVARIVMDGLYLCTGSLVNNSANDCKPLFLTANHCIMGGIKQDAIFNPDVSGYIFYWNYEVAGCNNGGGFPEQTTSGGTVLANAGLQETGTHTLLSSDFALIKLDENPRGAYDVYFNGWDASGAQGTTGVGIHHPAGDVKKISTHVSTPEDDGYYWALYWVATANGHSVTEGGSSGSPLFRENGLITGQLFGGSSVNCSDPANDLGLYGKLSYSWTNDDEPLTNDPRRRLHDWLDPIGGGDIRVIPGAYNPCSVPKVYFKETVSSVSEENATTADGCRAYTDYTYQMGITPYPSAPVSVQLFADGTADAGAAHDYELLTSNVSFNNVTNTQSYTIRVYDDTYVESEENVFVGFSFAASNSISLGTLAGTTAHQLSISSEDVVPQTHVQTVRNQNAPAEEYLGPFGTVYFQDPGSGGMMIAIENLSGHNYGCTAVSVDHAGGTANNAWTNGTTLSKTLQIVSDQPAMFAQVNISIYIDDNEVTGWEWFNDMGLDMSDLELLSFAGVAEPGNEDNAQSHAVSSSSYQGEDFVFAGTLSGLSTSTTGITLGKLSGSLQSGGAQGLQTVVNGTAMSVYPNLTRDRSQVSWTAEQGGQTTFRVLGANGDIVLERSINAEAGFNQVEIDAASWTPGMYWIQMIGEGEKVNSARLVKM